MLNKNPAFTRLKLLGNISLLLLVLLPGFFAAPAQTARAETPKQDPQPTPLPDPLENGLPDPSPLPSILWRPPLYPVPWSISDNDHFFFTRPIAANKVNWPLPAYRYGGTNFGPNLPHSGVDIVTNKGTPVLAAGAGTVVWQGYGLFLGGTDKKDPYGLSIAIEHDFGYNDQPLYTVYAHLSKSYVIRGQEVRMGDTIGASGDSGNVTGEHLHFEVRLGKNDYYHSLNPELWVAPPQGWGVLVGRLETTWNVPVENLEIRLTSRTTNQRWYVNGYGTKEVINGDPFYKENFVFSDLPAGLYEIYIPYVGYGFIENVRIYPGAVTYFNFKGMFGISMNRPFGNIPLSIPNYSDFVPDVGE